MAVFKMTKDEIQKMPEGAKKEAATALVDEACFMVTQAKKLKAAIRKEGWVETYQNGKDQTGVKKSSKGETYLQLVKNLVSVIKGLMELLPEGTAGSRELEKFLGRYSKCK